MNVKEAEEIINRVREDEVCNRNQYDYAKGYLEAIEKAERILLPYIHAKDEFEIMKKWEKEK